jgi:drug/metabolite transporter (DMT)-like permease
MLALLLGLASAITLAAANLAVKMGTDILVGRAVLSVSAAMILLPVAFLVPLPDGPTAAALAVGMPAHFFYQFCLVRSMQRGDLSLVFPIMRGLAPLLTAIVAFLLLREKLEPLAIVGLLIASGSVILFAAPPAGTLLRQHPDRVALAWALGTAVGIALYNVADARGVRIAPNPFTYIVWLFLIDWIAITGVAMFLRRGELLETITNKWRYGLAAGALSVLSFGAVLYAFTLAETAKVSALRETSVLFAALFGTLFLKEGLGRRRITAACTLVAGLMMMQLADV